MPPAHAGACGARWWQRWKMGHIIKYGKFCLADLREASLKGKREMRKGEGAEDELRSLPAS